MGISLSYWDDCVELQDLEALWNIPEVSAEWIQAEEERSQKVHLSRNPDGQPYLTQTEMRARMPSFVKFTVKLDERVSENAEAVADIVISRHFPSEIDPGMICAIAELESDRQLLVTNTDCKSKETSVGLMQLLPRTAEWLTSELGYCSYATEGNMEFLFKPFVNVYFGAAYIKWLSNFDNKERSEEFIVRAYKGGTKKTTHKSTLHYWKCYLAVKESFPSRKSVDGNPPPFNAPADVGSAIPSTQKLRDETLDPYWDSRTSPEDMKVMWNHPEVRKHWKKSKQKHGKVQFTHDEKKRPYLTRVEMKAVADIILLKYLSGTKIKSTVICAIGEVVSMRFVHGVEARPGIMGIDYSTANWLYLELGYRAYKLESVDDLNKPFVSMYFGAAYVAWLSKYEGRERRPEFFVQAYFIGPKNVNPQETSTLWLKFEETLSRYKEMKRKGDSCSIM